MKRSKHKMVFLEVTVKQFYGFEEGQINGWPTEKVIQEWFTTYDINDPHASRDSNHYNNTDCVWSVREIAQEELDTTVNGYLSKLREEIEKTKTHDRSDCSPL